MKSKFAKNEDVSTNVRAVSHINQDSKSRVDFDRFFTQKEEEETLRPLRRDKKERKLASLRRTNLTASHVLTKAVMRRRSAASSLVSGMATNKRFGGRSGSGSGSGSEIYRFRIALEKSFRQLVRTTPHGPHSALNLTDPIPNMLQHHQIRHIA